MFKLTKKGQASSHSRLIAAIVARQYLGLISVIGGINTVSDAKQQHTKIKTQMQNPGSVDCTDVVN